MKVLIEGLDNVGKDTQINAIIKHFKKTFLHLHYYGCPIKNDKEANIQWTTELYTEMFDILKCKDNVICNRSHIGEMVYAELYRGYSGDFVLDIEAKYPHNDLMLITFVDEAENLIERDDGLSFTTDIDKKRKEIDLFVKAHNKSNIGYKLLININNMSIEEVTNKVIEFITLNSK